MKNSFQELPCLTMLLPVSCHLNYQESPDSLAIHFDHLGRDAFLPKFLLISPI